MKASELIEKLIEAIAYVGDKELVIEGSSGMTATGVSVFMSPTKITVVLL